MKQNNLYVGCDMHKHYSVFYVLERSDQTNTSQARWFRMNHDEWDRLIDFLDALPKGTPVAFETVGSWYWFADLLENLGLQPRMAHALKAKVMMGHLHKTDKLDAKGLAKLLRTGTLPTVWIATKAIRDARALTRGRIAFVHLRTRIKNRISHTYQAYRIRFPEVSDKFGALGRRLQRERMQQLPPIPA